MNKVQKQIPPSQDTLRSEWARHNRDKRQEEADQRERARVKERGVDAELKKEVEGKRERKEEEGRREWQRGTMRGSPSICLNAAACPGGREPERVHSGLNKGCS